MCPASGGHRPLSSHKTPGHMHRRVPHNECTLALWRPRRSHRHSKHTADVPRASQLPNDMWDTLGLTERACGSARCVATVNRITPAACGERGRYIPLISATLPGRLALGVASPIPVVVGCLWARTAATEVVGALRYMSAGGQMVVECPRAAGWW